ncbi:hypothetical protein O6H91_19G047500 [Diphasiastrum complanatum]|uniref:Uncharacterized protein n=1 Tax=Diphasiastrum complanatum TaxID=34168 RepID=A0ACC2AV92_DIPCM|nr:hypothetical protein O6H91_19G047500 [Diphasiastrum complanatum]
MRGSRAAMAFSEGRLLLHTGPGNKNSLKSLIAAEFVGVKIEVAQNFQMGVSNKTREFLKLNPLGKVPVLETPDGAIFESNAIARYVLKLKNNNLLGSSLIDQAHVDQWIDFATTEIDSGLSRWVYPRLGYEVYSPEVEEFTISAIRRSLGALNTHLTSHTYLVGHSVTLSDIVLICNLSLGYRTVFTEAFTADYPHVGRYFWTLVHHPQFKKHLGTVVIGERTLPPPPKTSAVQDKSAQSNKESNKPIVEPPTKPNKESNKPIVEPPTKPKQEVSKPKEESLAAGDEDEAPSKPKAKHPLDLLPPSSMVLDNWKRLYSNTKAKDFRKVAIKGFWEMYDPEGYSLWFCDYKYDDENTVPFVTMNKVSGFLQRMDFIRKFAFAKICILGKAAPYKIKGVWLFRGPEIPQQVKDECYDIELYDWIKVNISDEVQKERVNAYFEEPDEIGGEKLLEAKCFK